VWNSKTTVDPRLKENLSHPVALVLRVSGILFKAQMCFLLCKDPEPDFKAKFFFFCVCVCV
jgi:hypothetical protein